MQLKREANHLGGRAFVFHVYTVYQSLFAVKWYFWLRRGVRGYGRFDGARLGRAVRLSLAAAASNRFLHQFSFFIHGESPSLLVALCAGDVRAVVTSPVTGFPMGSFWMS